MATLHYHINACIRELYGSACSYTLQNWSYQDSFRWRYWHAYIPNDGFIAEKLDWCPSLK